MTGGQERDAQADADIASQLEAFGAPPEVIAQARGMPLQTVCYVWPENEPALRTFLAMATQWRAIPLGLSGFTLQGMDYASLPVVMDLVNIPTEQRHALFEDLRIMENAALAAMNEQVKH